MTIPRSWQRVLAATIIWRIALFVVGGLAHLALAYKPSFPYAESIFLPYHLPQWVYSWANFDGVHYLTIMEKGYVGTGLIQAFFPLYPTLSGLLRVIPGVNSLVAGLLIANGALLIAMLLWWELLSTLTSAKIADRWWWVMLVFPSSFFLGAFYTESLFLCCVFGALWAGIKGRWWLAAFLAGLASACRVTGVFLVPALWLEWWTQTPSFQIRKSAPLAIVGFGVSGLAAYMVYLWRTFGDPLFFFHVQSEFGAGRQESVVLLPQVLWRYIKILLTYRPIDLKFHAFVQEFVLSLVSIVLMIMNGKKIRPSILLFSGLAWLLPTLTGTFSSMPRYILACPAFFVAFILILESNRVRAPWLKWLVISLGLAWMVVNGTLFIQGYWVA